MKLRNLFKKKAKAKTSILVFGEMDETPQRFRHFYFLHDSNTPVCNDPERLPDFITADFSEADLLECTDCRRHIINSTEEMRGFY